MRERLEEMGVGVRGVRGVVGGNGEKENKKTRKRKEERTVGYKEKDKGRETSVHGGFEKLSLVEE